MRKILIIASLIFILTSCTKQDEPAIVFDTGTLAIGDKTIGVEIADTGLERAKGLSTHDSLCYDCGMIFLFPNPKIPAFWMRNMDFSIDIIWIKSNKITEIFHRIPYTNQNTRYSPPSEIDSVLEVNAGWAKENDIQVGDKIELRYD